jgi:hypothetical protein
MERLLELVRRVAEIPSFSSFDERLHPFLFGVFNLYQAPRLKGSIVTISS